MPSIGNLSDLFKRFPAPPPAPPLPVNPWKGAIAYREDVSASGLATTVLLDFVLDGARPILLEYGARPSLTVAPGVGPALFVVTYGVGGLKRTIVTDGVPGQSFEVIADYVRVIYQAPIGTPCYALARESDRGYRRTGPRFSQSGNPGVGASMPVASLLNNFSSEGRLVDLSLIHQIWIFRQTPAQTGFVDITYTGPFTARIPLTANAPTVGPFPLPGGWYLITVGNDAAQNQGNIGVIMEYNLG